MILTKTSTRTDKSSFERLISLPPNFWKDAILFRDVWPVLQSDWIAVYAAKGTTQCRPREQEGVATRDHIIEIPDFEAGINLKVVIKLLLMYTEL